MGLGLARGWCVVVALSLGVELALQFAPLVAQEGGALEFHAGHGFVHLLLQLGDDFFHGFVALRACAGGLVAVAVVAAAAAAFFAQAFLQGALHALRGDAVAFVVGLLDLASLLAGGQQGADALGHDVGEEYDLSLHMAGGAACGLDE